MPAESTAMGGEPGARSGGALPALSSVPVADDRDVEPLLGRAAADLSALTLRLGAATHRADAAEARASLSPEDEATELRSELEQDHAEHQRLLDLELAQARAEASQVIDTARAYAIETVRAASTELGAAVAAVGGSPTPSLMETPVKIVVPADDVQPEAAEQRGPSFLKRVVHHKAVWLIALAIVVILLFVWVR